MKYLFVPVLLGLAMAGCTSSEPQGIAAVAPTAERTMPAPAAPSFNSAAPTMPTYDRQPVPTAPAPVTTAAQPQATTAVGFPPPPPPGLGTEHVAPARLEKCRTVGSVTTCDVPSDPSADNTRYTN